MDSIYFGLSISFLVMALIAWRGYQKYKKPILWLGFMPILSVAHSFLGLYLLGLGFSFIGRENLIPYWVKFLSPTFIGVKFLGLPLEMLGLHDNLAYLKIQFIEI